MTVKKRKAPKQHSKKTKKKPSPEKTVAALPWQRWELWVLGALILIALVLRVYRVSSKSFYIDEMTTYGDAMAIFRPQFWHRTHFLSFILVRVSLLLGYTEFTLRLPSLLFSILSVPMMYITLRRWFRNRDIALIGALLTCVSLYQLSFAHEARYYSLVTFVSCCSLYLLFGLLKKPALPLLLGWLLVNFANYGIHPTTAVFFFIQIVFWMGYLLFTGKWKRIAPHQKSRKKGTSHSHYILPILIISIILIFLVIGYTFLFGQAVRSVVSRLAHFPKMELTRGVGFTPRFFLTPIFNFSVLMGQKGPLSNFFGYLYVVVFGAGIIAGLVRWRVQTLFVVVAYCLTFVSLFLYKASVPFASKYIVFLYPCYVYAVAIGLITITKGALKVIRKIPGSRLVVITAGIVLLLLQAGQFHTYYTFYAYDSEPFRPALEYIRSQQPEGGMLATTGFGYMPFNHYRKQYGFEKSEFLTGIDTPGQLINLIRKGKPFWYCPIFAHRSRVDLAQFPALSNIMDQQKVCLSYNSTHWNIPVYFIDSPYICLPGRQKEIVVCLSEEETSENHDSVKVVLRNTGENLWEGDIPLITSVDAEYTMTISETGSTIVETTATLRSDGTEQTVAFSKDEQESFISPPFTVAAGRSRIHLALRRAEDSINSEVSFTLFPERGAIPAVWYTKKSPAGRYQAMTYKEKNVLVLKRNGWVEYTFDAARDGLYQLSVEAVNDKPRPVAVEVCVNERPAGILSFEKKDNAFSVQSFPATLNKGTNTVTFSFLNDGPGTGALPDLSDKNTDFIMSGFAYTRAPSESISPSPFLPEEYFLSLRNRFDSVAFDSEDSSTKNNLAWTLEGDVEYELLNEGSTLKLVIPPDAKQCLILTQHIDVEPDKLLYCAVNIGTENMRNHSANVSFIYYDHEKKYIREEWVHPNGITNTTEGTRFPCIRVIPQNTAYAAIALVVYQNSARPGKEPETVWFSDFEFLP